MDSVALQSGCLRATHETSRNPRRHLCDVVNLVPLEVEDYEPRQAGETHLIMILEALLTQHFAVLYVEIVI